MARGLEPNTGLLSAARLSTALHQGMIEIGKDKSALFTMNRVKRSDPIDTRPGFAETLEALEATSTKTTIV